MDSAVWNLCLNTTCPSCEEYFDILSQDNAGDLLQGVEINESGAVIEVTCPQCLHEFEVKTAN